jgi:hypothetical protein
MKWTPKMPIASWGHEKLADWLELEALTSADQSSSMEDLVGILRRTNSVDAIEDSDDPNDDGDPGSELAQSVASSALSVIEARHTACGGEANYPFKTNRGRISLCADPVSSNYIFLLMLTVVGPKFGPKGTDAAKIFEELCTVAAQGYLGGPSNNAKSFRFGSPRASPYGRLHSALDYLCVLLNEGGGCSTPEVARHNGDDQLDIVAWREFPDRQAGKIVAFGQCAAGSDASSKMSELNALAFSQKWFREPLAIPPVRLFFVPWDMGFSLMTRRRHNLIDAGIIFDRCRIVACESQLKGQGTFNAQVKWSTFVLTKLKAGRAEPS